MKTWERIYIDGSWRRPGDGGPLEMRNSSTEEVVAVAAAGTPPDVDAAVEAAGRAFPSWSATPAKERADHLAALAMRLAPRLPGLAADIAAQVGMPLPSANFYQSAAAYAIVNGYAGLLSEFEFDAQVGHSVVTREPVGVVGCITPWNYPLVQTAFKVAPALAAGCTVVLKPTDVAPLAALVFAEAVDEAGLPPGVFNLVTGRADVGQALVAHPGVDMISFTGSTATGRHVAGAAAAGVKKVALELGGKSANLILDDADLERAVTAGVQNCFLNSGQTCFSWSRMLVPAGRYDDAVAIACSVAEGFVVGDPLEPGTTLGPLVSAAQRDRVRRYIALGRSEGARLATGGVEPPGGLERGWFVRPTVFADVDNRSRLAQEEIFGPVLAVIPHRGDDDAVALANDTIYGLHGAVWSADGERAVSVARRLRTGAVDVNGAAPNIHAPFGGYKQSGYGREWGRYGLEEFLLHKAIQI
jgi:aldehyde dehydrogenase (NAD+)